MKVLLFLLLWALLVFVVVFVMSLFGGIGTIELGLAAALAALVAAGINRVFWRQRRNT
ncbi:hypothetical protein [Demequina sediminicola]|uniref:hypothetical protein n=1 Tax=Demequina sediminicola TaxID=1095026 RepID=UPI000ADE0450|nr:hypothetical protein [Demequina sediminicola]